MPIYVAVIDGRALVAFYADGSSEAGRHARDPLFRDDLMTLATGGLPLWNGITDVVVRQAFSKEEAEWRSSRAKAISQGNIDSEDNAWTAFLVPLSNPNATRRVMKRS
jgi:hypothetical protein